MERSARKAWLWREIAAQKQWIKEHGGDLAGYVERYGSKDDPEHYGDGGELIYAADVAALAKFEAHLARLGETPVEGKKIVLELPYSEAMLRLLDTLATCATEDEIPHLRDAIKDIQASGDKDARSRVSQLHAYMRAYREFASTVTSTLQSETRDDTRS